MQPSPRPLGQLVSLISRASRQLVAAQVEPLGLSVHEFWTLVHVAEHPSASQAELAAHQHVDEATTCRVVRALSDAGLLAAVRDPADRRRTRLELTAAGSALSRRVLPVARAVRAAIESSLAPAEREACRAALVKILDRLDAMVAAAPAARTAPAASAPRRARSSSAARAPGRRVSTTLRGSP